MSEKKIPLVESFGPTIQGEGAVIGYQTIFLRFGGCDYRCGKCDSLHAVLPSMFKNAPKMTNAELLEHTLELAGHCHWITFSGGNPCMWDLTDLVAGLKLAGKMIAVETQGTLLPDWLAMCDMVTVSPKGPGMDEVFEPEKFDAFVKKFHPVLEPKDPRMPMARGEDWHFGFSVKVVVFDQRDLEFMVEIMERWPTTAQVMFASIGNVDPPAPAKRLHEGDELPHMEFVEQTLNNYELLAREIWEDPRCSPVRVLPQLHTLLWGNKQGV